MANQYSTLNFGLGETVGMLRDQVRQFANKEIAPVAVETDKNNEFPNDLWKRFGEMGLLGITVDESLGGSGMGYLEHTIAMEEISRRADLSRHNDNKLRKVLMICQHAQPY